MLKSIKRNLSALFPGTLFEEFRQKSDAIQQKRRSLSVLRTTAVDKFLLSEKIMSKLI